MYCGMILIVAKQMRLYVMVYSMLSIESMYPSYKMLTFFLERGSYSFIQAFPSLYFSAMGLRELK